MTGTGSRMESAPPVAWRRWLLVVLVIGEVGILLELFLLKHYEDSWQIAPLALAGGTLLLVGWYALRQSARAVQMIRLAAIASCLSAALGIYFHFRANVEWELETTPEMHGWELFREVVTGALPLLAPGAMLQLGLIALIWSYRHPQLATPAQRGDSFTET